MRLKEGLKVDSHGGHGPVRYFVKRYTKGEFIEFQFTGPRGLHGVHFFKFEELSVASTKVTHIIDIKIAGQGLIVWPLFIKWLHNALAEDALDKVQNHFDGGSRKTNWSIRVKFFRTLLG